jgi:pyruvate/oxaloacetate carboxyltransferase
MTGKTFARSRFLYSVTGVTLMLAVAACSTGSDTEETAAGSDVSETTTLPATTTIPPTTTTTIAYDSVKDLQAQFDGLMAALAHARNCSCCRSNQRPVSLSR